MRTASGATKNATNSAASGSTSLDSAIRTFSGLDLAIEALDQRATLRIELGPVEAADLGEVFLGLGQRFGNGALERDLGTSRDHVVRRLEHLRLNRWIQMQVDIFHRKI